MMTGKNILITGGTGAIGRHLINLLLEKGYNVNLLSRNLVENAGVKTFLWDLDAGTIDENCIDGVDTIIHLAGANIAEKPWSKNRKKQLIESRTKSIGFIYALMQRKPNQVRRVISASAIGYYGNRGNEVLTETSQPGNDFLAKCCIAWENKVDEGAALGLQIVKLRTGIVFDAYSGALKQLAKPIKYHFGAMLGNGKQWVSWIHLDDVLNLYLFALETEDLTGVYNMVAPHPVTNAGLTKAIARHLNRTLWLPPMPAMILRLILGEMSKMILASARVSANEIIEKGFRFKFKTIEEALSQLYGSGKNKA